MGINEVVEKRLTEDTISYSISYFADDSCGPFAGQQLTGGRPDEKEGKRFVRFFQKHKNQYACVIYDNRPDLEELVIKYNELRKVQQDEIEAERAKEEAADQLLLNAMYADAEKLRRKIPKGHVEAEAKQVGSFDGYPQMEYSVDGFELMLGDVKIIGWASAIRPGAMGSFKSVCIASIDREKLAALKKEKETAEKAAIEKKINAAVEKEAALKDAFENELFIFGDEFLSRAGNRLLHSLGAVISQKNNRVTVYTTGYSKLIPGATTTREIATDLKDAGFSWDPKEKEWFAAYSEETGKFAIELLKKHDTKANPAELGLSQCWECGRWCKPSELDASGYCGC